MNHLNRNSEKGFSLIEMAFLLIIIGLLAAPMIAVYNTYIAQMKLNKTGGNMGDVLDSINLFIRVNGRYPRPAPLNLVEGDPGFGAEGTAAPEFCSSAVWFTSGGICQATASPSNILIGAVPFDALALDIKRAHDYWGNKLLYAVSVPRTDKLTYKSATGGLTVDKLDSSGNPTPISSNYDMILVSFGETAKGAYSQSATLVAPCIGTVPENEDENCDFDNEFLLQEDPGDKQNSSVSHVSGARFYDDFTEAQSEFPLSDWYLAEDEAYAVSNASRIGVGTTDPEHSLEVIGDIGADSLKSDSVCDYKSNNCFDPEIIAGDVPSMDCHDNLTPDGEPVLGIWRSSVECASAVDSGDNSLDGIAFKFNGTDFDLSRCPPGQILTGIDASGMKKCAPP